MMMMNEDGAETKNGQVTRSNESKDDDTVMEAPVIDEKEEELTEENMSIIRRAMEVKIKDDLDNTDGMEVDKDEDGRPGPQEDVDESKKKQKMSSVLLSKHHINMLADLKDRSKYIPMRLNTEERVLLNVVEGALDISEYTDNVDVSSNNYYARTAYNKEETVAEEQENLCKQLLSLGVCNDHRRFGGSLLTNKKIHDNEEFYQDCMEIGRRYKIMNPDKMRSTYGKLLYVVMDNVAPRMNRHLQFSFKKGVKTVYNVLESCDLLGMLEDPLLAAAASEITPGTAEEIAMAQQEKKHATEELMEKYVSDTFDSESMNLVISSICDSFSFLRSNRDPVDQMINYLKRYFNPNVEPSDPRESLRIRHGAGGSKLSHSHETQYYFVLQSLTLWREIMGNFFKLWCLAEEDLLDSRNGYRLCNTGQGLQRCQGAPRVQQEMSRILGVVKAKVGRWIGLSVVHLGDRDVPNALIFIDKYTQVPRLLSPIVHTLNQIDSLTDDPSINQYIEQTFNGKERLRKLVLADYFRHGFDGSGDDGGSCIDGRLTSTWNWCSKLEKKEFHPIFMLTDFVGFDGDFR